MLAETHMPKDNLVLKDLEDVVWMSRCMILGISNLLLHFIQIVRFVITMVSWIEKAGNP